MSDVPVIRVLLVEDDEDVRLSTTQMLTLAGFEVEAFATTDRLRLGRIFPIERTTFDIGRAQSQGGDDHIRRECLRADETLVCRDITGSLIQ